MPNPTRGRSAQLAGYPGPLTLLQIAVGIIDLGRCAAAMYMLVPNEPIIRLRDIGGNLRVGDPARDCQPISGGLADSVPMIADSF
jgi:hypothetical protein